MASKFWISEVVLCHFTESVGKPIEHFASPLLFRDDIKNVDTSEIYE
jgi:hypothetical protein